MTLTNYTLLRMMLVMPNTLLIHQIILEKEDEESDGFLKNGFGLTSMTNEIRSN